MLASCRFTPIRLANFTRAISVRGFTSLDPGIERRPVARKRMEMADAADTQGSETQQTQGKPAEGQDAPRAKVGRLQISAQKINF